MELDDPTEAPSIQRVFKFPVCVSREIGACDEDQSVRFAQRHHGVTTVPTRKDFRHGKRRLFHLNQRLLTGLIDDVRGLFAVAQRICREKWEKMGETSLLTGTEQGGGDRIAVYYLTFHLLLVHSNSLSLTLSPSFHSQQSLGIYI